MRYPVYILIALLAMGCELFQAREPEDPIGSQGNWDVPIEPQDVLNNLTRAMLDRNAGNYMRSFAPDSFQFFADPLVLQQQPAMEIWGRADEQVHIDRLFGEGVLPRDSLVIAIFSAVEQTVLGDTALINAHYDLTAQVAIAGAPGQMSGEAQFTLGSGDQGYWEIRKWSDRRSGDLPPWSDLKALVRSP